MTELLVLGPVELLADGTRPDVGPPKQRLVLAVLAAELGRPVAPATLIDRVWDEPPTGARQALYSYLARIRRVLAEAGGGAGVTRRSGGYLLGLDPDRVDVHRFRRLVDRARRADTSDPDRAAALRAALALWRGPALAGLPGGWAEQVRVGWHQERLDAARMWGEVELRLGNAEVVVAGLRPLLAESPLTEPLVGLLIRALAVDGRAAEALDLYALTRRRLAEELGSEPGAELRRLGAALARGTPDPASRSAPAGPPAPAPPPVPAQLPPDVSGFTGRGAELRRLHDLLDGSQVEPTAVLISAIAGTAGVGKTALALRWAHQVAPRFGGGQLYVDLRGYGPDEPVAPADALASFLRALGVAGGDIPYDLDERAARYRTLLAGRRMLVVLDNASSVEQVRPLLPGRSGSTVVVTSRDALAGLVARDGVRRVDLDLLAAPDAVALLRTLIGDRVDAEPAAADTLADQCARLPLALRIAAELAAADPAAPLSELVAELADEQRRLDLLGAGDDPRTVVRAVFSWSYRRLPAAAARTFHLLGLHPGREFDRFSLAALAGTDELDAARQLTVLHRAHLVQLVGTRRYSMHDLLRVYAADLVARQVGAADQRAALTRLFDYYLAAAAAALDALHPAESHLRPRVSPVRGPIPDLAAAAAARAWLDVELPALTAVSVRAATAGWPTHVVALASILWRHLHTAGHHAEALTLHTHALRAARETGDRASEATVLRTIGSIYWQWGRYEQSADHFERALTLFRQVGDRGGEARALGNLGILLQRWGRYEEAVDSQQQALALFRRVGDQLGAARTLDNLGIVHWLRGRYPDAAAHHQEALALFRRLGDRVAEAIALGNLGLALERSGQYDDAHACFEQALLLHRDTGDRVSETDTLDSLGLVLRRRGEYAAAADHHLRALALARETGYRVTEATVLDHLGSLYLAWDRPDPARDHHQQALALARELGYREAETSALNGLGEAALRAEGRPEAARVAHEQALALALEIGDRFQQARAHDGLGHCLAAVDRPADARRSWELALAWYAELGVPEAAGVRERLAAPGPA